MFGTGILSYFSFLRFLVMLNFIIFLLMFSFIMLPIIIAPYASGNSTYNQSNGQWKLVCSNLEEKPKHNIVLNLNFTILPCYR